MASFLQTREWEEIQRRMGRSVFRVGGMLCVEHALPFGMSYWYVPRPSLTAAVQLAAVAGAARRNGVAFLRVEAEESIALPDGWHTHPAANLQPSQTIMLDLGRDDAALLAAMHPKTRYNIRLAERHGVTVRWEHESDAIHRFQELIQQTAARDGFHAHPSGHYAELLAVRSPQFSNELAVAYVDDKPAAAAIVNMHGGRATYLHGASDYAVRHCMAPHLLHWDIMRAVRARGATAYDLWGIDDAAWPGVSRFKRGFGGLVVQYPPAVDIALSRPRYALWQLQRYLRGRRVRGFSAFRGIPAAGPSPIMPYEPLD